MFTRLIDYISRFCHRVASWLCLLIVIITTQQVIARYFFSASSIAIQELEWHAFGLMIMLSVAWTWRQNDHVRVDIFYSRWTERRRAAIDIFGILFFALPTFVILIVYGWSYAAESLTFTNTTLPNQWSQAWFPKESMWYAVMSHVESFMRTTILQGEASPDPGGLPGRWLIKASIPLAGILLLSQALCQLPEKLQQFKSSGVTSRSNSR